MFNNIWYANLIKPALTPPQIVFSIVWPILYLMIGLSLFFYLKGDFKKNKFAIFAFIVQLLLNFAWSPVFFKSQNPLAALVILVLMIIFIVLTIVLFFKKSKLAGLLLIPYLIWTLFAFYLNLMVVCLNYS